MTDLIKTSFPRLEKTQGLAGWVGQWSEPEGFAILFSDEAKLPTTATNSDCSVIFEGFLQNQEELLVELGIDHLLHSNVADTIVQAFCKWQENLVYKVRGVFSLAIWDKRKKSLLYVRDHCGVYPSFYSNKGSLIVFSTSVADLVRHPSIRGTLNPSTFVDYLCHRRPMPEETYYAEIQRVLPGHIVRFTNASQQVHRYWYSSPPQGIQDYITDPGITGFDEMFETAIRRSMQIGNPGIFLSGGLDSVSIACVAVEISKAEGTPLPMAFSMGFPHPDCNEVDRQTNVAHQLGLKIHLETIDEILAGRRLFEIALDLGRTWSQPMLDCWQGLYIELGSRAREMGCKVIMTGSGGDEWLNVSDRLIADLIRSMDPRALNRVLRIFLRSYRLPKHSFLYHLVWKSGLRMILADTGRRIARQIAPATLRKIIRKRMKKNTLSWVAADPELKAAADDRIEILVEQYMNKMLPNDKYPFYASSAASHFVSTNVSMIMEQHFEASQRMGVSVVYPYFDPDLINLLMRVSPEALQQGGMEKGIVRKSVAKRFPNLKFEKQKKVSAMGYWQSLLKTEGRDLYYSTGGPKTLIEMGVVDGKKIGPVIEQSFAGSNPFAHGYVWDLLCLETWARSRLYA